MKTIFKLSLITLLLFIASCAPENENNPKYAANLEIAKNFMLAHGTEDIDAQSAMIHDDLLWQPPMYGSKQYGKLEHIEALKMYQTLFE